MFKKTKYNDLFHSGLVLKKNIQIMWNNIFRTLTILS